jgi:hypothetical protein
MAMLANVTIGRTYMPSKRTIIEILFLVALFLYATISYEYELIPAPGVVEVYGVYLYTI